MMVMEKGGLAYEMVHGDGRISDRAADALAAGAGSWTFIISFLILLGLWMVANIYAWMNMWDPYPFILLNLVLSMIAALQAPVILMSQNRQAEKDRRKLEYDYKVNRTAERGIEMILRKVEALEGRVGKGK